MLSFLADDFTNNDVVRVQTGGTLKIDARRSANAGRLDVAEKGVATFEGWRIR
jgi:hypothetical protein